MRSRFSLICIFLVFQPAFFAVAGGFDAAVPYAPAEAAEASADDGINADDLESRIARELVATGQMADGDPQFDAVVAKLREQGLSAIQGGEPVTENWIRERLQAILPHFENASANAAASAAVQEISKGAGKASDSLIGQAVYLTDDGGTFGGHDVAVNAAKETLWRSGLEGLRAAASASDIYALTHLEMEYSLSEGGLDEYALLTVQPLYESADMRHTLFAQVSYANAEINDRGAGTSDRRDTVNGGLAYRYITTDEQHMFGANALFDHQWAYHHNRMSLGLDYKTSLIGAHLNHYIGLSDWRSRGDGYEEKALSGTDLTLSGRLPQAPELELFVRGFHWDQDKTATLNPDGDDIWGYALAAEYTPVNVLTLRGEVEKDNDIDEVQGTATVRLNYNFGQRLDDLFARPSYNLDSVMDRRFDKVRRINEVRVQVRRDPDAATEEETLILGLTACPAGALSVPADLGCARNFDAPAAATLASVGVFAGYAPDGGTTEMFVSRCNMNDDGTVDWTGTACAGGDVMSWDAAVGTDIPDVGNGDVIATTPRANDGRDNTDDIIAQGIQADEAAQVCRTLGADWYLPAIGELDVMYANLPGPVGDADNPRTTVGGGSADPASFTDSDGDADNLSDTYGFWINNAAPGFAEYYWSSSENFNGVACYQRFSDGGQIFNSKSNTISVRCVRRD